MIDTGLIRRNAKKVIIFLIFLSFFSVNLFNIILVKANASTTALTIYGYYTKSASDYRTSSSNNFPSTVSYSNNGYYGTLYEGGSYVFSGEAPKQTGSIVVDTVTLHHAVHELSWGKVIDGVITNDGWEAIPSPAYESYFSRGYVQVASGMEDYQSGAVDNSGARYLAYSCYEWAKLEKREPTYSGDTRVWRNDYEGTVSKSYVKYVLDAVITTNIQEKMFTGNEYTFDVKAKNTSDKTWNPSDNIAALKTSGTFPLPNNKLEIPKNVSIAPGESYTWNITMKAPSPGKYNVKFQMNQLGEGNFGNLTDNNINVYSYPSNGNISVNKYDYKENNNIYWVKNKNDCEVLTDGYLNFASENYPDRNYLSLAKDGDVNSNALTYYSDVNGTYHKDGNESIFKFSDKNKSYTYNNQNRNYLKSTHSLSAINEGSVKLYFYNTILIDNVEYPSNMQDSGIWLKVDGTAPTGTVLADMDSDTYDISVDVRNVTDNGGSGVKEVFAMYYNANNKQNGKVRRNLSLKNGNWVDNVNSSALFNDDIEVEIYAVDNVGNQRLLDSKILYRFNVKATIVPYNDKSYSGSKPTLKRGQKGVIKIATTGEPTQLQITFSNDLLEQDNSLNATIDLQPKKQLITEYEFIVPLYSDMKDYAVNVKAIKGNRTKEVNPQFIVNDSIIDNLRTRRKY